MADVNGTTRNSRVFSDLDFNFTAHPVTGDVARKYDENAVKASIKNLLLTGHFERPFHSEIGSPIRQLLFEPASPMTLVTMKQAITDVITNFEPRVTIIDISLFDNLDNNAVAVTLVFKIKNTTAPIKLDLVLERTR
jgi:phage baseplate assembly protein W